MALVFYPHTDDTQKGSFEERIEILLEAAERFKTAINEAGEKAEGDGDDVRRPAVPRDQGAVYNWDALARILRELRELPEGTKTEKSRKAGLLTKLAEVYEVLRAAKMSKLEAVRLALMSEATQLRSSA